MRSSNRLVVAGLLGAALFAGCGTDGTAGSAPVITELTLDPTSVARGTATISARFVVTDADRDANAFQVRLVAPGGAVSNLGPSMITGLAGNTGVPVTARIALILNVAGQYTLEVQVNDAAGHASNRLGGTLTVM